MHVSTTQLSLSFLLLVSLFFPPSLSDPRATEVQFLCNGTQFLLPTIFIPLFTQEMNSLSHIIRKNSFATHNTTISTLTIYTLAQCHNDLSQTDCFLCYSSACTKLSRCLPSSSSRVYLDGCFLRYDNYDFMHESVDHALDNVTCSDESVAVEGFERRVDGVLENVTRRAVGSGGFGVGEIEGVYALAQCWKSVSAEGCRECLRKGSEGVKRMCGGKKEGRAMNAGCFLRYSTAKFYNDGNEDDGGDDNGLSRGVLAAVISSVIAVLMIFLLVLYGVYVRLSKIKREQKHLGKLSFTFSKSSLAFKYETLEKATNYFSPAAKLGQGGNGSVYKGTLPSGEIVAVKRLIFNTRQWVDEFFNEVNLISGIQHKNLVKLLGCSIEGPESLLVYEYVPNKSLDQYIFDENKTQILSWKERINIIVGTAEGLAYLHEGSPVRIIHRDIKSSNVLLDKKLNPKIADFGLARCFAPDKSHLSTGIAGTLGYMAPEYLVRGQLTEKADVYSFGVLVLEIVCGRRNNAIEDSGSLLQAVWKLNISENLAEAVNPCLKNNFPSKEAANVIQVGLLCTQASAALRPSMAQVVRMLSNEDCDIPAPSQPPFINSSVQGSQRSTGSSNAGSLASNTGTRYEVFDTSSSESTTMQSKIAPDQVSNNVTCSSLESR